MKPEAAGPGSRDGWPHSCGVCGLARPGFPETACADACSGAFFSPKDWGTHRSDHLPLGVQIFLSLSFFLFLLHILAADPELRPGRDGRRERWEVVGQKKPPSVTPSDTGCSVHPVCEAESPRPHTISVYELVHCSEDSRESQDFVEKTVKTISVRLGARVA